MSPQLFASAGVLATAIAVVSLAPVALAGQPQTATVDTWTPPRASWGDPDLQGIWDFRTLTPVSRPRELAGKEFFTEEEAAELDQSAEQRRVDVENFVVPFEPAGTQLTADRRTSLIVGSGPGTQAREVVRSCYPGRGVDRRQPRVRSSIAARCSAYRPSQAV